MREPRRIIERPKKTARFRDTSSGDIERRPMVDGRPNDRQPQRDIHCPFKVEQLQRYMSLIVVHAYHGIESFLAHG